MRNADKKIAIDKTLFFYELTKRGLSERQASLELGYSQNYFTNCANLGYITRPAFVALNKAYGIKLEDLQEPEATAEPTATGDTGLTYQDISAAVSAGVLDALTRFADDFAIYKVGGVMTFRRREDMRNED